MKRRKRFDNLAVDVDDSRFLLLEHLENAQHIPR